MAYKIMTAEEAASLFKNGDNIAFSGFTPAGAAKAIPTAIAERAKAEHAAGKAFKIKAIPGASGGPSLDGVLSVADALEYRAPYQASGP